MKFQIKALQASGGVVSTSFEASDEADALRQARGGGLLVLALRRESSWTPAVLRRNARFPLGLFSQELLSLLEAGLTLVEAIEGLAEKESQNASRTVLEHLRTQLHQGRTLSQAMDDLPQTFPALFVATVRATERTGDLPDALRRYIAYQSQLDLVRKKIVSASIYPMVLMGAGVLVMLFLLGYVVPKFSHVYEDIHGDLPLLSRALLQAGQFLDAHGPGMALLFVVAVTLTVRWLRRPALRAWIGATLRKFPAVGERMRVYQLARFYRTLGMLLRGGTPVVSALDMASGLLSPLLRARLSAAALAIREGRTISEAMSAHQLTTPVALRMLRVGERTGRMDDMMERIAAFYDDEISRWVDWFTRLFEPLLMAFIGVVIGAIVVLMYLPVFELAGSIQ
ncbi:MAG: type II secretion system F family protein [Burkholderiales bacterium]